MLGWISFGFGVLLQLIAAIVFVTTTSNRQKTIESTQSNMAKSLTALGDSLNVLSSEMAVTNQARIDGYRRLEIVEGKTDGHEKDIQVLRTKVHDVSTVVQRLDPEWRPYNTR